MAQYKKVTFSNSHAAVADTYSTTDLLADDTIYLNVLTGDPASATLYSIGSTNTSMTVLAGNVIVPTDIIADTVVGANYQSTLGATIFMTATGQVGYDMRPISATIDSLAAGRLLVDTFYYAIRMADGTVSWNTVTVNISGKAADIGVFQQAGLVTEASNWQAPPNNPTDTLTDGGAIVALAASGNLTTITVTPASGDQGTLTVDPSATYDSAIGGLAYHFWLFGREQAVFNTQKGYGEKAFTDSWTITTANGTTTTFSEDVYGNIHAPVLTAAAAASSIVQGSSVSLNISATDHDDNASLSYNITGVPANATLSDNGGMLTPNTDGSYTLTPGQLTGLTLTPNSTFTGTISLAVTATNTEGTAQLSSAAQDINVTVTALAAPSFMTLINFTGSNGSTPFASLITDVNGNLFGTTVFGPAGADAYNGDGSGTVFQITNNGTIAAPSYASSPTTLVTFNGSNGSLPETALVADANGDLFGTTASGGAFGNGTVFEMINNGTVAAPSYGSSPTTLVSFRFGEGSLSGLIADANGDLFGTTESGSGTVFELTNNGTIAAPSYASSPTTLVNFNGNNGLKAIGSLVLDAKGDLFGTAATGGAFGYGTLFEIVNNGTVAAPSYASSPTTLVDFNGSNGSGYPDPQTALVADANGDLFGTTAFGGVFELTNNGTVAAPSYASSPTILHNFGASPLRLIVDADGDLFGTAASGGAFGYGMVFEMINNGTVAAPSYGSSPTTLVNFNGSNGQRPEGGLFADANGDLFGTTANGGTTYAGGLSGNGTVFEIINSGYVVPNLLPHS
jgi:VCBS repeat-containing protein